MNPGSLAQRLPFLGFTILFSEFRGVNLNEWENENSKTLSQSPLWARVSDLSSAAWATLSFMNFIFVIRKWG